MNTRFISLLTVCSLIAGCTSLSTRNRSEVLLNDDQIAEALAKAKQPQQFGFAVYPTGNNGIAMRGNARLHPRHVASAKFVSNTAPVIKMNGSAARMKMNALIDPASAESWFEFSKAKEFRTSFLGLNGRTIPYQGNAYIGQAEAYAAVIPQMRIDQLFIEDSPVYVRMALNSLGPLSRGIQDSNINSLIGYDILSNFEYIQFDLSKKTVAFSATIAYTPNETLLTGKAEILRIPGIGLTVKGGVDGTPVPIILDFAGNYSFAINNANITTTAMVELGEVVYLNTPTILATTVDELPRAGLKMLEQYLVTVCPRAGVVYFEQPAP